MKVRIIGSESRGAWYADRIGEVFDVIEDTDVFWLGCDAAAGREPGRVILKDDCKIVEEGEEKDENRYNNVDDLINNINDLIINEMKENWHCQRVLRCIDPDLADALEQVPSKDLIFLGVEGWIPSSTEPRRHDSKVFRLRPDWERPKRKAAEDENGKGKEKNGYDGMGDEMIERMKKNLCSMAALRFQPEEGGQPDLAEAFEQMDSTDLEYLGSYAKEWYKVSREGELFMGTTYRLRPDYEPDS